MKNRIYNKLYAKYYKYFWFSCPLCSQMFGGHEWGNNTPGSPPAIATKDLSIGEAICPDCGKKGLGTFDIIPFKTRRA